MINFGLVGYGRFGVNYAKNLIGSNRFNLLYYCCNREKPIDDYNKYARFTSNYRELVDESLVDVVIVASPPSSHYEICKYALSQGKHVICEKPFVFNSSEARELHELANLKGLNLIIDFVHLFNPNFTDLRKKTFDCKTMSIVMDHSNYGPFREYDTLLDYGSHGLAMSNYIMMEPGKIHSCKKIVGGDRVNDGLYSITIQYSSGNAIIFCGNTGKEKKCRFVLISEDNKYIYSDDGSYNSIKNLLVKTCDAIDSGKIISNSESALDVTMQLEKCMELSHVK